MTRAGGKGWQRKPGAGISEGSFLGGRGNIGVGGSSAAFPDISWMFLLVRSVDPEEGKAPLESKKNQDSLCCSCGCRSLLAKPALGLSEIIQGFWNLLLLVFQDWRGQWEFLE